MHGRSSDQCIPVRPRLNSWAAGNQSWIPEAGTGSRQGPTSQAPWTRPKLGRVHTSPIKAFVRWPILMNRGPSHNPDPERDPDRGNSPQKSGEV